jgi:predicted metal-binding membrane protein
MDNSSVTEEVLRRDRWVVIAGLLVVTTLAWLFMLGGAGTGMSIRAMTTWQFPPPALPSTSQHWSLSYWALMLAMWWVMMIAMMVPSATPTILLYARVTRHAQKMGLMEAAVVPTAWFAGGYLLAWFAFSIGAVVLQWSLEQLGLMHVMMMWSLTCPP